MVAVEKAILEMITLWGDFMGMSKSSTLFHRVDFLIYELMDSEKSLNLKPLVGILRRFLHRRKVDEYCNFDIR